MSDSEEKSGNNEERKLFIYGVPMEVLPSDLRWLFQSKFKREDWRCTATIITKESKIVQVACANKDIYKRFFSEIDLHRLFPNYDVSLWAANRSEFFLAADEYEQMLKDYQQLSFAKQEELYKSGGQSKEAVSDIWTLKFQKLYYSPEHFQDNYNCTITTKVLRTVGQFVKHLIFNSAGDANTIDGEVITKNIRKRMIRRDTRALSRSIKYLVNLELLEVQGRYLKDKTIKLFMLHCHSLLGFHLLDIKTRGISGRYFHRFPELVDVDIDYCINVRRSSVKKLCSRNPNLAPLQRLSAVGVPCLSKACDQLTLCSYLYNITELRLSAVNDEPTITAILGLEQLKVLALYWPSDFGPFDIMLLRLVCEMRANSCCSLKFVVDQPPFKNEWYYRKCLSNYDNAMKREMFAAAEPWWGSDIPDSQYATFWKDLKQLKALSFEYCRPVTFKAVMMMPVQCPSLEFIQFIGCADIDDFSVHQKWQVQYPQCTLRFLLTVPHRHLQQQLLTADDQDEILISQRSIECRFE